MGNEVTAKPFDAKALPDTDADRFENNLNELEPLGI